MVLSASSSPLPFFAGVLSAELRPSRRNLEVAHAPPTRIACPRHRLQPIARCFRRRPCRESPPSAGTRPAQATTQSLTAPRDAGFRPRPLPSRTRAAERRRRGFSSESSAPGALLDAVSPSVRAAPAIPAGNPGQAPSPRRPACSGACDILFQTAPPRLPQRPICATFEKRAWSAKSTDRPRKLRRCRASPGCSGAGVLQCRSRWSRHGLRPISPAPAAE
eukprot:scaffold172_cov254-Pinguiococcus_pyrenoidosus.AAC.3